jgi:sugar phosphate isomerase/epimerase
MTGTANPANLVIGIMQGRLSPLSAAGIQAFPLNGHWQPEFDHAGSLGFGHVEWLVDLQTLQTNPIFSDQPSISRVVDETGIQVRSLCLHAVSELGPIGQHPQATQLVQDTIDAASNVGIEVICLPLMDLASLQKSLLHPMTEHSLHRLAARARELGMHLALETDLSTTQLSELLGRSKPNSFSLTLDVGNLVTLGGGALEQYSDFQDSIRLVHLKDRTSAGQPVALPYGASDVIPLFAELIRTQYAGIVTLEGFRGPDFLSDIDSQLGVLRRQALTVTPDGTSGPHP